MVEYSNFYKLVRIINNMGDWREYINFYLGLFENPLTTEESKRVIT